MLLVTLSEISVSLLLMVNKQVLFFTESVKERFADLMHSETMILLLFFVVVVVVVILTTERERAYCHVEWIGL